MTSIVERAKVSQHASRINRVHAVSGSEITWNPIIGKDILEVISSAMYVDPRVVYREYIQNAADAVEDAYDAGLLNDDAQGRIDVSLDAVGRAITIRDNGIGLPSFDAAQVLTALGASAKREEGKRRGFRGIGRFAGLGYAQLVSFKTKAAGENVSTEIRWDCRKLKAALTDRSYKSGLTQLVREAVSLHVGQEDENSPSFFEVRLERVVRIKNDILLNPDEVGRYLGEVGPVPFHSGFSHAKEIVHRLKPFIPAPRFRIFLNGSAKPITRPHRLEFAVKKDKVDAASHLEIHELTDTDGRTSALVWLMHHGYQGAIHASPEIRGLRARVGDMQIGDDSVFLEAFREQRFNSWAIGEVHVLDPKIIPNARRDGFEQNGAYSDLIARLAPLARSITHRCRASSARRYRLRAFSKRVEMSQQLLDVLRGQALSKHRESRTRADLERILRELSEIAESKQLRDEERASLARKAAKLRDQAAVVEPDRLEQLPRNLVPLYHDVVEIVSELSPSKASERTLIDAITHRFVLETKKKG